MKIGLIGAGIMGHGIALNLLNARHDVSVIAHRNRAPIDDLISRGAAEAATIAELAGDADAIVICVTDSAVARSVIAALTKSVQPDALVIDITTNAPDAPVEFADTLATVGAHYIEAPVTGGATQAKEGVLGAIVGCSPEQLDRARIVLSAFCKQIEHFGPPGMGARAKLVSNFLALGTATLVIEAFRQARDLDVDWQKLYDLVQLGSGNSAGLRRIMDAALEGDFGGYVFSVANTAKDLSYFSEMMGNEGSPSDLAPVLQAIYQRAVAEGHGDRMLSELLKPEL